MSEWLRRNRWGLMALPLLALLVVVANGSRLERFWWNTELNVATAGSQGDWVDYEEKFTDAVGDTSRTLQVRLDEVAQVAEIPRTHGDPIPVPGHLAGWQVDLSWRADPDQILRACSMALLGDDGQRYQFSGTVDDLMQNDPSPCVLLDQPGPMQAIVRGMKRTVAPGEERPATWATHPIVFLPQGVEPTDVLIWWERPQFLDLKVQR